MIRPGAYIAAFAAAALVAAAPVQAQRATLAERVDRLERQAAQPTDTSQSVQLVNRLNELQSELAMLRGRLEQQAFEIEELKQRNRDQYIDLDTRLERLEGGRQDGESFQGDPSEQARAPVVAPAEGTSAVGTRVPVEDAGAATMEPADERSAYEAGFDALKDGRYSESARRFQTFIDTYPDGEYAPNAWYWLGESYYVTQNFELAKDSFRALLERHPESAKAPDALLKLGYCQYELRDWEAAERTLTQVVERYPDTTVARLAQGRLRALMLENR